MYAHTGSIYLRIVLTYYSSFALQDDGDSIAFYRYSKTYNTL